MERFKFSRKVLSLLVAMMLIITSLPLSIAYAEVDGNLATVESLTDGDSIDAADQAKLVVNYNNTKLDWFEADPSIDRTVDGWWIGIRVKAPSEMDDEALQQSKFKMAAEGDGYSFWENMNSDAEKEEPRYIDIWYLINEDKLNDAKSNKANHEKTFYFDWDGSGDYEQDITISVDPNTTTLYKKNVQVYPRYATVEKLTGAPAITDDGETVTLQYDKVELDWVEAAESIGRTVDGWWIGFKVHAPENMTEEELAKSTMTSSGNTTGFLDIEDSKPGDDDRYINIWYLINEEKLNDAVIKGGTHDKTFSFDWAGCKQDITLSVDPAGAKLNKNGEQVYPSDALGSVSVFADEEKIDITDKNTDSVVNVTVKENETLKLDWSPKNKAIGRNKDGWWFGVKITAPEGMDQAALEKANFQFKAYGKNDWTNAGSFWAIKDSADTAAEHFTGFWIYVDQEMKDAESTVLTYARIDWDGDGVYEQTVAISLDTKQLELDPTNLYAMDKAAPEISEVNGGGDEWVSDQETLTIDGTVVDNGTTVDDTEYTSGIQKVVYSTKENGEDATEAVYNEEENKFSFELKDEFAGTYYIFAIDNAGNQSEAYPLNLKFDNNNPVLSDVKADITNWTKDAITITGNAKDSLSGIDTVDFAYDGKSDDDKIELTEKEDGSFDFTLTIHSQTYNGDITITAADKSGRTAEAKVGVLMDTTKCIITSADADPTEWTNQTVTISGTAAEKESGLRTIKVYKDEKMAPHMDATFKETEKGIYSFSYTLPAQDYEGNYVVYGIDNVGLESDRISVPVKMDVTAPTLTVAVEGNGGQSPYIHGKASDELSGIAASSLEYCKADDEGNPTEYTSEGIVVNEEDNTYRIDITEAGAYFVRVKDTAGNVTAVSSDVEVDTIAPDKVVISYENGIVLKLKEALEMVTFHIYSADTKVTLTAEDEGSGIKAFHYAYGDTEAVANSESEGFKEDGNQASYSFTIAPQYRGKVKAYAEDKSGNYKKDDSVFSDVIIVDAAPGTINAALSKEAREKNGKKYYDGDVTVSVAVNEENFFDGEFGDQLKEYSEEGKEPKDYRGMSIQVFRDGEPLDQAFEIADWARESEDSTQWNGSFKLNTDSEADEKVPDGEYKIVLSYTDPSGNKTNEVTLENFVIDTTAPVVEIRYDDTTSADRQEGYFNGRTATIEVTDRNFDADAFEAAITATAENTAAQKALADNKWQQDEQDSNVYTLTIPYTDEAAYTFDLKAVKDFAGRDYVTKPENEGSMYAKDTETPESFTVDVTKPEDVVIRYDSSLVLTLKKALEVVTFHFYQATTKVTLSAEDNFGIHKFYYNYQGKEESADSESEGFKEDGTEASYTFEIAPQYRGQVTAYAVDKAGNSNKENSTTSDTIVVDAEPGTINAALSAAANEKDGIKYFDDDITVNVAVNEENFMDGEFGDQLKEYGEDKEDYRGMSIAVFCDGEPLEQDFEITDWARKSEDSTQWNGSFILKATGEDRLPDGEYTLQLNYTDLSGNKAETYEIKNFVIATAKPVVEISYDDSISDDREGEGFFLSRTATIEVTDRFFDPETFKATISATDLTGATVDTAAQAALAANQWQQDGDVFTLTIPYTDSAIYTFALNTAKNLAGTDYVIKTENEGIYKKGTETPASFTVDNKAPIINVSTDNALAYKLLNALTFGFFDKVKVTVTVTDTTAGFKVSSYASEGGSAVEGTIKPEDLDKSENGVYEYSFTISEEYKDTLKVDACDKSGNSSEANTITDDANNSYDGIVVDTTDPVITTVEYQNSVNNKGNKYYYDGNATAVFTVDEEYFFAGYGDNAADAAAEKNAVSALANDVALVITKDGEEIYNGSAVPDEANSNLFTADLNEETKQISVTLLSDGKNDGDYTIQLTYTDLADHTATVTTDTMVMDTTAPVLEVAYNKAVNQAADNDKTVLYYNAETKPGMVVTVTEKNFCAENFVSNITGTDIKGNPDEAEAALFAELFSNIDNWTQNGDTYTIAIPLEANEYNYKIDYAFTDEAQHSVKKDKADYITYDTASAAVKLSISDPVVTKVLNAITFGIFDLNTDAKVTITTSDLVGGIETIAYSSKDVEGGIGSVAAQTLNVKNNYVNNVESSDGVNVTMDETGGEVVTYTFTIPAEFRNALTVTVKDYAGNAYTLNSDDENGKISDVFDGIIKDTTKPGVPTITIDSIGEYASKNTFAGDFDFHVVLSDNNAGIGEVAVTINGVTITEDATGKALKDYYSGDSLISGFSFDINTVQMKDNRPKDGAYKLAVTVTDNAGNVNNAEFEAYIDVYAPMVSEFSFESKGKMYSGDREIKGDDPLDVEVKDRDTEAFAYYFENDTYVTVKAIDYDTAAANKHTAGIKAIRLIAENASGEAVSYSAYGSIKRNKQGYAEQTFLIKGPFKGNIYAQAEDFAGNYPLKDQSKGQITVADYIAKLSAKHDGYVNPYDSILENADKHRDTSSIEITPNAAATTSESYRYSYQYSGTAQEDKVMDYKKANNPVPLYKENASFTLTVNDNYSGIKEISWQVIGQEDQDSAHNQRGTVKVNNHRELSGDSGWKIDSKDRNLATTMSKNITVTNNSNDIVILVELTDRAGNKSYDYYVLGIDQTKPDIAVSASGSTTNGSYLSGSRTLEITVTERNFDPSAFTLKLTKNNEDISVKGGSLDWDGPANSNATDSTTHTASYTVYDQGDYTLSAEETDLAGNANNEPTYTGDSPTYFIIDTVNPTIRVEMTGTSANEKYFFNTERRVTITVTDRNFDPNDVTITINGSTYTGSLTWDASATGVTRTDSTTHTASFALSDDGDYTFDITCNDLAERTAEKATYATDDCERFTIDKTPPTVDITEMIYQSANSGKNDKGEKVNIPITVTVKDDNLGNMYSGDVNAVSENEVAETLKLHVQDTSDFTKRPEEKVVEAFAKISQSRTELKYSCANLTEDGVYTLDLNVKDCAGNTAQLVTYPVSKEKTATNNTDNGQWNGFTFSVNRNGSTFIVEQFVDKYYVNAVDKPIIVSEINVDALEEDTKNNVTINAGDNTLSVADRISVNQEHENNTWYKYTYSLPADIFTDPSRYYIDFVSHDAAGHANQYSHKADLNLEFILDTTAPIVSVDGVIDGSAKDTKLITKESQVATVTVSDDQKLEKVEIYINDDLNSEISLEGDALDKKIVDGRYDCEYTFNQSSDTQKIRIVCVDAAGNKNASTEDNENNEEGFVVDYFVVSADRWDILRVWLHNNVLPLTIGAVAAVGGIALLILFLVSRKRKKDDEEKEEA